MKCQLSDVACNIATNLFIYPQNINKYNIMTIDEIEKTAADYAINLDASTFTIKLQKRF